MKIIMLIVIFREVSCFVKVLPILFSLKQNLKECRQSHVIHIDFMYISNHTRTNEQSH